MTEKRFTLFDDGETIIDNESVADDGGKEIYWTVEYIQVVKLVDILNELAEKNKELKRAYNVCKFRRMNNVNEIYCLKKENEKLKEENEALYKQIDREYYMKYR